MASGSTGQENDEEYQQFKNMLGEAPIPKSQTSDAKSAAYADFADMLGLDGSITEQVKPKKSVAKLSSKKSEIDPADYNLFDAMLERTGGRGTKPMKGGKRYTPYLANDKKRGVEGEVQQKVVESEATIDDLGKTAKNAKAQHSLTAEEKAQAYAAMMEEFGPGIHDAVETWSPDEDVSDLEPHSTQLLVPPERPDVPRPAEPAKKYDTSAPEAAATYKDTIDEADSLTLDPKPPRPTQDHHSSLSETSEHSLPAQQNEVETAAVRPSSPLPSLSHQLEKGPLGQSLDHQSQLDENEFVSKIHASNVEVQAELNPSPTRSSRDDEIGNHQALVLEPQPRGPLFRIHEEKSKEGSTVALHKPKNQPDSFAGSTVSNRSQPDADAGQSRPFSRKQISPNRKLKQDGPVEVLKNPMLMYKIDE